MHVLEFYAQLPQLTKQVICFRADDNSALFFSLLAGSVREKLKGGPLLLQAIDTQVNSAEELKLMLSVSFLGQQYLYWFKNIASDQAGMALQQYLSQYKGPHHVIFTTTNTSKELAGIEYIELPTQIDTKIYNDLFAVLYPQHTNDRSFVSALFSRYASLQIDQACLMMQYQMTIGRRAQQFLPEWTDKLINADLSLFTLSGHMFALEAQPFFLLLEKFKQDYSDEFWVVYWAEQLWQAILFSSKAAQESPIAARKLVTRLPFSFMNKDWRKFSLLFLVNAHAQLYKIDFMIKNGQGSYALELWYHTFFSKGF